MHYAAMASMIGMLGSTRRSTEAISSLIVLSTYDRIRLVRRSNDFSIPSPRWSEVPAPLKRPKAVKKPSGVRPGAAPDLLGSTKFKFYNLRGFLWRWRELQLLQSVLASLHKQRMPANDARGFDMSIRTDDLWSAKIPCGRTLG